MSLEDLGNIGEFVGAIGVIVSLVYLAIQIRQNTRSVRAASYQEAIRDLVMISDSLATDPELSRIYWTGLRTPEALTESERHRFGAYMLSMFRRQENLVYQTELGALDRESWEGARNLTRMTLAQPGGAAWWARSKELFGAAFRAYVHREFQPRE